MNEKINRFSAFAKLFKAFFLLFYIRTLIINPLFCTIHFTHNYNK